jgi:hypothetical protein
VTIDNAPRNLDPSDDPLLDWHSDARLTMDAYANEVAYRQIAGTQVELLRRAAAGDGAIPATEVATLFAAHSELCKTTGQHDLAFTVNSFVGFLTARALLKAEADGYVITSVGRDLLNFIDDRGFPPKAL